MSDLIEVLKKRGYEFNFFQAVTLLEEYYESTSRDKDSIANGRIRFAADPDVVFPSSDIHDVKIDPDGAIHMFLSFMGLLGISSPLPHYFTEYGAMHVNESCALTDFLNIFDHRIYTLFYRAWKKYRTVPTWSQGDNFELYNRIASISGLGGNLNNGSSTSGMTAYAGLLSSVAHSSAGLSEILTDCLKGVNVKIEQWAPRWAKVSDLKELGINFQLGKEAMIGDRIFDRSGKIEVILELTDREMFSSYLPGSENIERVKEIVMLYAPQPLAFDIEVKFKPTDLVPVVLGQNTAPLGISSSCGEASEGAQGYSITIPGRE